ncbi:MAG: outer membrane lipoprotein carrier protein LolA, partial [Halobacterium sp.]
MPSPDVDERASVTTIVVAAALLAVVVTAGVWLVAAPDAPTGQVVGSDASAQYAAIDGVRATETTVVRRGDETSRTVVNVSLRPGTELRQERVVSGDRKYEVSVSNGSVLWLFDEDAGAAKRIPLSATPAGASTRGDRIERLFTALNVTRESAKDSATFESVAPLPVVPEAADGDAPWTTSNAALTITYEGTEAVDGRKAYVVHVEPATTGGEEPAYSQTLWVDAETFFPLKQRT